MLYNCYILVKKNIMQEHQDHEEPKVKIEYSPGTVSEDKPVHKGRPGIKTKLFARPMHPEDHLKLKKLAAKKRLHATEFVRRLIDNELGK